MDVLIIKIEGVGNYAIRIIFDDGHNTGIYSWEYLHEIGIQNSKFNKPIANNMLCFLKNLDLLKILSQFFLRQIKKIIYLKIIYLSYELI